MSNNISSNVVSNQEVPSWRLHAQKKEKVFVQATQMFVFYWHFADFLMDFPQ